MKKILLSILFLTSYVYTYAQVKISIYEPIRFHAVNVTATGDMLVGEGSLEVTTDNLEEDYQKKIILKFADTGLMNNNKRWIKVSKYEVAEKDKEFLIEETTKRIKFYAYVKKRDLNDGIYQGEDIEGVYKGRLAIVAELYGKPRKIKVEEGNE